MRLNDPTNNKIVRKSVLDNQYRSTCSVCREGIFEGQETVWGRGDHLGLCHKSCLERAVAEAVLLS